MVSRIYYPLTPSQMSLFLARKYTIHKSVTNVPTSIIIHASLDLDVLEDAVREAISRWDSFGIRLIKEGKIAKQYFGNREVERIKRLDFSKKTKEEMENTFRRLSAKKLEIYNSPMARIYLITTPEGYNGIFSIISHLIMDSWAISSFYKDLMEIYYYKLGRGEYPDNVIPYEMLIKNEVEYKETKAYEKAKAYWENEFSKSEPIYTHINGLEVLEQYRLKKRNEGIRASNGFFLKTTAGHDLHWINKEDVDKFLLFIKDHQLPSMQVLFQMALRTYLAKVNGYVTSVNTMNVVARRGTLKEKRTGGTRVHFYVFRTEMEPNITFIDACQELLSKQNEIYRHADFDPMEMLKMEKAAYGIKDSEGYGSASMTFQPVPMKIKEDLEIETKWYTNGAVSQMLYITIMDGDGTGGLKCYYEYMSNHISAERIKELHEAMVKIMVRGCEEPDITLEELFKVF